MAKRERGATRPLNERKLLYPKKKRKRKETALALCAAEEYTSLYIYTPY